MMNKFEIIGAFFVPFIKIKFSKHKNYNFFESIEKRDHKPDDWKVPVQTTFPNVPDDNLYVSKEKRELLKSDLISDIKESFVEMNMPSDIYFPNFWYNVYHNNQGQESHNHLSSVGEKMAYWSGIYYYKNSSPTIFTRSDYLYKTNEFPGWDKSHLAPCFYETFYPYIEDGDVVLFPPYLEHSVPQDDRDDDKVRVTFAFNVGLNF